MAAIVDEFGEFADQAFAHAELKDGVARMAETQAEIAQATTTMLQQEKIMW